LVISISWMACLSISIGILRRPTEAVTYELAAASPLSLPIFVQEEYMHVNKHNLDGN